MRDQKLIFVTLLIGCLFAFAPPLLAQEPPPPPASHGQSGNQEGAPIGGGLFILLGMAGVYGGYKGYKLYREKKREETE